ncbi:alpha/beta fold hydrolase [Uniformispora flossi]|uniref:alpha/beta fold hydrolase n=1 Tax=Uniformispora flossi TaxID=3390723 RepID=UPI003C2B0443
MAVSGTELGLVLVHGFASGPKVWEPLIKLVEADPDLTFVGPMTFGYATGFVRLRPDRRIPSLDTVADSFTAYFDTEATAPEDLVIVGHSQGGLIIQRWLARMLAEGRGSDLARVKRVVLLACPNNGSQLGAGLRQRWLRRNEQEEQLRPLNEQITDTQRIVLRDIVNATQVTARTCPIPFSVYAGESDNVVVPASARSVFPNAAVLPGDHFSIVRPTSARHRTFTTLRRLLLTRDQPPPPGDSSGAGASEVGSAAPGASPVHVPGSQPAMPRSRVLGEQALRAEHPAVVALSLKPLTGHRGGVRALAFSPDGTVLAVGTEKGLWLWDPVNGNALGGPLTGHKGMVNTVVFSPDGTLLATAGEDKSVCLRDPGTGTLLGAPFKATKATTVFAAAFSPDSTLLATSGDGVVRLWDPRAGVQVGTITTGYVRTMAFSPDGSLLATGGGPNERVVRLWDIAERRNAGDPLGSRTEGVVFTVAFSPDGSLLAAGSGGGEVRFWHPATRRPVGTPLICGGRFVRAVAFSPDGRVLATGHSRSHGGVRLWDPETRRPVRDPLVDSDVSTVAFSPDGSLLAAGGGTTVWRWSIAGTAGQG